jgi:hypothetical protein
VPIDCVSNHRAYIYDRGGVTRLAEITQISELQWNRVRDDMSEATINVNGQACQSQGDTLGQIEPGRHELVLYRGEDRVWEGPVNRLTYTRDSLQVHACDVSYYLSRTVMHNSYDNSYPNVAYVIDRAALVIQTELARKEALDPPVNVLPFLTLHQKSTDAKTSASTVEFQYTVFEHLDNLAARSGLDYTVIGRAIHLWDTHERLGLTPVVTENDFLGDVTVSVYGSELATRAIVTDGQGAAGTAGGIDPFYGEWETLATAYDEEKDESVPTQSELDSQAQRNLTGRMPTPMQVRIPDGSSVNPTGVLSVGLLVPGVYMPLRADMTIRQIQQTQKLNKVTFTETAAGEDIQIVLYPASNPDVEDPEGGL